MEKNIKKEELDFVHEDDLLLVLQKLGLKDDFLAGKLRCVFCDRIITNENLFSFFEDDGVKIGCNEKSCIESIKE